jgi:hypothetical protein
MKACTVERYAGGSVVSARRNSSQRPEARF